LIFANDTCLCAEKEVHLEAALHIFSEVWFGLKVSVEKTEMMVQKVKIASFVRNPRMFIGDNQLKTYEFKYLGSLISNRIEKEVQSRFETLEYKKLKPLCLSFINESGANALCP